MFRFCASLTDDAFQRVNLQQALVLGGGVVFNLLLAWVATFSHFVISGKRRATLKRGEYETILQIGLHGTNR